MKGGGEEGVDEMTKMMKIYFAYVIVFEIFDDNFFHLIQLISICANRAVGTYNDISVVILRFDIAKISSNTKLRSSWNYKVDAAI